MKTALAVLVVTLAAACGGPPDNEVMHFIDAKTGECIVCRHTPVPGQSHGDVSCMVEDPSECWTDKPDAGQ